ncbi:uncharacterized protein LOC143846333 [Tasmannia lanceolata]|uniref:uncharacterized protein LOC143846333 n=1 Tax=Tasmannia lanceolata TaxID=3420 RepID=UPI004062F962
MNANDAKEQDKSEEPAMPASEEKEEIIKKKYGGIKPKKPPLIKDNERAYFDSADWALRKQGAPVEAPEGSEALPPKLQPTPSQQTSSRRSPSSLADGEDGGNAAFGDPNNE